MINETCTESPYYRSFQKERCPDCAYTPWADRLGRILDSLIKVAMLLLLVGSVFLIVRSFPYADMSSESLLNWVEKSEAGSAGLTVMVFDGIAWLIYRYIRKQIVKAYVKDGMLGVVFCLIKLFFKLTFLGITMVLFVVKLFFKLMDHEPKDDKIYDACEAYGYERSMGKYTGPHGGWKGDVY